MAYVIVFHKDREVARRPLEGPMVIGRSTECDLPVHDILLSRRHCRIEPDGDTWTIADLGSKNGTRIGGTPVFKLPLTDRDVIRMGKTAVRFREGAFVPAPLPKTSGMKRPADPFEALAGTVTDFTYTASTVAPNGIPLPTPKPVPREPAGYVQDDVRSMVSELVSSSWDSMYEMASRPDPVMQQSTLAQQVRRKRAREPRVDIALQVHPEPEPVEALPLPVPVMETKPAQAKRGSKPRLPFLFRRLAMIFQWLAIATLVWPM
jgi:predicted component of type VI protein secretion system